MKFAAVIITFFIACSTFGQQLNFRNYTTESGLSSNETYKIIQDKQGYMWVATDAGICRFNGLEFKIFTVENGLPTNTIFEIYEDKNGTIWGGGLYGGVFYIRNDSIYQIAANPELNQKLNKTKSLIRKIFVDEQGDLHIGSTHGYYTSTKISGYSQIRTFQNTHGNNQYIMLSSQGLFYSALDINSGLTKESILVHTADSKNKILYVAPHGNNLMSLPNIIAVVTQFNTCLVSYQNFIFRVEDEEVKMYAYNQPIVSLYVDRLNNLWIGFLHGGYKVYKNADLDQPSASAFNQYTVSSFVEDKDGGMWLTTTDNGIYYCANQHIQQNEALIGKNVVGVGCINNQIYLGLQENKIYRYGHEQLQLLFETDKISPTDITHFYWLNNKMYKASGPVMVFDEKNPRFIIDEISHKPLHSVQMSTAGDTILGLSFGYLHYVYKERIIQSIELPSKGYCMKNTRYMGLLVGCIDGLYKYEGNVFKKVKLPSQQSSIRISYIAEDKNGRVFIATKNDGLFVGYKGRFIHINQKKGLSSNICNHIYIAHNNRLCFISTNRGINILSYHKKLSIRWLNLSNGLASNEVNAMAEDSLFYYVATKKGLNYFSKDPGIILGHQPHLYVRSVKLGSEELQNDGVYAHSSNQLSIQADVLSYQDPSAVQLKIKLLPYDTNYQVVPGRYFKYDNLYPGNYSLLISAVDAQGNSSDEFEYHFKVDKPFWQTTWFIVLAFMVLGIIIYIPVTIRIKRIRLKEQEKNALLRKILETKFSALIAQMNPHFLFNVINSIQEYVLKNDAQTAYDYLASFSLLMRKILKHSRERFVLIEDELNMLQLYVELESLRLGRPIQLNINYGDTFSKKELIPPMILQPIIENSVWHGLKNLPPEVQPRIDIWLTKDAEKLTMRITDNGLGCTGPWKQGNEKEGHTESFGLKLVEERLALLSPMATHKNGNIWQGEQIIGFETSITIPNIRQL